MLPLTTSSYSVVKNEIVTRFNQGDLEYVLLVGDTSYMPIATWDGFYSDYYYACITGAPDFYSRYFSREVKRMKKNVVRKDLVF